MAITLPSQALDKEILDKASRVKLLVLDVDGVLSDGKLYFSDNGNEIKAFNSLDGHGIKMLQATGVTVAVITGRRSNIVQRRCDNLNIQHLLQGREDKATALDELRRDLHIELEHIAYVGDDLPDLSAIRQVGLGICVPNGDDFVALHSDWVTSRSGGNGAVREICEAIMQAQDTLNSQQQSYL